MGRSIYLLCFFCLATFCSYGETVTKVSGTFTKQFRKAIDENFQLQYRRNFVIFNGGKYWMIHIDLGANTPVRSVELFGDGRSVYSLRRFAVDLIDRDSGNLGSADVWEAATPLELVPVDDDFKILWLAFLSGSYLESNPRTIRDARAFWSNNSGYELKALTFEDGNGKQLHKLSRYSNLTPENKPWPSPFEKGFQDLEIESSAGAAMLSSNMVVNYFGLVYRDMANKTDVVALNYIHSEIVLTSTEQVAENLLIIPPPVDIPIHATDHRFGPVGSSEIAYNIGIGPWPTAAEISNFIARAEIHNKITANARPQTTVKAKGLQILFLAILVTPGVLIIARSLRNSKKKSEQP